ncbi:MAG: hypothetical protein HYT89_00910 [Candidatus Omnitrophica bacterium]|nr:hypothetical protein [Candidatus Omnitrophota bacterium]
MHTVFCEEYQTRIRRTEGLLRSALEKSLALGTPLILASTTGDSAKRALDLLPPGKGRLVVVTYGGPSGWFDPEILRRLEAGGHAVLKHDPPFLLPTRFLCGISRILNRRVRRQWGEAGVTCVEIAKHALRAGRIGRGSRVVAVAGQEKGLDTALMLEIGAGGEVTPVTDAAGPEKVCLDQGGSVS